MDHWRQKNLLFVVKARKTSIHLDKSFAMVPTKVQHVLRSCRSLGTADRDVYSPLQIFRGWHVAGRAQTWEMNKSSSTPFFRFSAQVTTGFTGGCQCRPRARRIPKKGGNRQYRPPAALAASDEKYATLGLTSSTLHPPRQSI